MDVSRWLSDWLNRRPLKEPARMGPDYTREVMSKLTLQAQPARPARQWLWLFPNPVYALVSAAAVVLIVTALVQPQQARLAELPTDDETWIQQTLQLLEELEQSDDATSAGEPAQSDDEWLQELEMIDEADLATSS